MREENKGTAIPGEETVESKARGMGWVDKEEFKGDESKWRPADEFVERGENILPIVKQRLDQMKVEFTGVQRDLLESRQTIEEIKSFFDKSLVENKKQAYQLAMADIEQKQREAVEVADMETYDSLQGKKGDIYRGYQQSVNNNLAQPQRRDPVFTRQQNADAQEFISKNSWFNSDREMNEFARSRSSQLTNHVGDVDYSQLEQDVRAKFPNKFQENPRRKEGSPVEGSGEKPKQSGKKTFENLPQSAREQYDRFSKDLPNFTKSEYLASYHEQD